MSKVWITRTLPSAEKTAEAISDLGFEPFVAPLLIITPPDVAPDIPNDNALLIFTSQNGVCAFCELTDRRHWPVMTVGDATAQLARSLGFLTVNSAAGTSENVTELILKTTPTHVPIIHCAGEMVRGSIIEDLIDQGYSAKRHIYYKTVPVQSVPETKAVKHVLLHSPIAAKTLRELNLDTSKMIAVCISEAVKQALNDQLFHEIRIATAPNETALLACLHP